MNNVILQLRHEEWAYQNGYNDEFRISLVSDFLNGIYSRLHQQEFSFTLLPYGLHISKSVRESFYRSGQEFAKLNKNIIDSDIKTALSNLFCRLQKEMEQVLAEDSILASTGDCRGACAYNTGDRSEYRNYGW